MACEVVERRRRKDERLGRQSRKLGDEYSTDQAEHAVRSIPTNSGGMIR
jgi:hypothetical protein